MNEATPQGLLFCELEIPRKGHAEVNASLVRTARSAYPEAPIRLLAERRHLEAVDRRLRTYGVEDVALEESPLASDARLTMPRGIRLFGALVRRARREGTRRIVFLSCSRRRVGWAKVVARRLPDVEVMVVLHETDFTFGLASGGPVERLFHRLYYRALPPNLTLLVLGPWIAAHAHERYPFVRGSLAWMWHPYDSPLEILDGEPPRRSLVEPLVLAYFGVAKPMKGADDFAALAERLAGEYGPERLRCLHLGRRVPRAPGFPEASGVESAPPGEELSRERIGELAAGVHYAVYPYDADAYSGRSSGALHDALAYRIPLLAYRGPMFESYFAELGDIGDLVDSPADLERVVRGLLAAPPHDRYRRQLAALERAAERLSCAALAEQFRRPTRPE